VTWSRYAALPPYLGGRRKLVPRIFKEISRIYPPDDWSRLRLVDPFLGGGAVSLYAKARGFGVLCGDLAECSAIIGQALIANDAQHLTHVDLRERVEEQAAEQAANAPIPVTVVLLPPDHEAFQRATAEAKEEPGKGANRGRLWGHICRHYLNGTQLDPEPVAAPAPEQSVSEHQDAA
jgi:site-specific DNA-adenine methylase